LTTTILAAAAGADSGAAHGPIDLVALLLILAAAWAGGNAVVRLGYPAVLGELGVGIILGPPLLGLLYDGAGLAEVGELGIILMMIYVGSEIDFDDLRRASKAGLLAALGGFIVPFALGFAVMLAFGYSLIAAIFVGSAVGVTSLTTKSRILADLQLFGTRLAYVLMAGALLSDTATLMIFAGVLSFNDGGADVGTIALVGGQIVLFVVVAFVGGLLLPRASRWVRDRWGLGGTGFALPVFILVGLGYGALAGALGLHPILGAFIGGMIVRRGMLDRRDFNDATRLVGRVSIGLLAPVFFVTAGFQISLSAALDNWVLLLAVVAAATLGKIFGTALFYLPTGYGWREGLVAGGAMNGRGAVEIIVAGIGLEQGLISTEVFTVLVLMAILTTATVPIFLKLGVEWLRTRGELAEAGTNRRAVTIIGAGSIGRAWALALGGGSDVWLLDSNAEHVAQARNEGLRAVNGDALDPDSLRRARADEAGLLLALTANDEVNVLVADLADEDFGVPDIRVAFHGDGTNNGNAARLLANRHANALFDVPVDVERWGQWLDDGQAAVTTIVATAPEELFQRLGSGRAGLPLAVTRGDDVLPFPRVERLYEGDRVTLVSRQELPHAAVATAAAGV
jgi:Kef-type K+ transport system membrane component KefB